MNDGRSYSSHPANRAYSRARVRFDKWAREQHPDVWWEMLEQERRDLGATIYGWPEDPQSRSERAGKKSPAA
jgi:hypothetical protein